MYDLTVEKIIEVHDEIILKYDGAQGVLSEATLHFMVLQSCLYHSSVYAGENNRAPEWTHYPELLREFRE